MISLLTRPDSVLCLTLALASMLAAGAQPELPWRSADPRQHPAKPSWLPCIVLVEFAVASTVWAVLHPLDFAALIG